MKIPKSILFTFFVMFSCSTYSATEELIGTIGEVWTTSPDNGSPSAQGGGWVKFNPTLNFQTSISCDAEFIFIKSNAETQMSAVLIAYSQGKQIRIKLNDALPKGGSYCQADHIILY